MRLINADTLIYKLENHQNDKKIPVDYRNGITAACVMVEQSPVIKAELVRHGRWETIKKYGRSYIGCSKCEQPIPTLNQLDLGDEMTVRYCPNCGAKMEGDDDENN